MFLTHLTSHSNLKVRREREVGLIEKFVLCNVRWRAEVSQSGLRSPGHLTTARERSASLIGGKAGREV